MLRDERHPAPPIIAFDRVEKHYGKKAAIVDLSLTVATGSIYALLGPNGAGKTTTIRLMSTLTRPSRGRITVAGHDVVKDAAGARRHIGVVFQNHSLDEELTVGENLHLHALIQSMQLADARRRANELLELMGMAAHTHHFVRALSGGEKRRIEIARALLHQPRILYLDEPSVGLDTLVRNTMWEHLRYLTATEALTVVFTTHYLEEAEAYADSVAVINSGRLLACGSVHAVSETDGASGLPDAYLRMVSGDPS